MLFALAILSGVSFTLIGVAYRLGQTRGVAPIHAALVFSGAAAVFFGVYAWGAPLGDVPARVWAFGVIVAVGQYCTIKLVRAALARGPLSPFWCACSLGFVPAILYALVAFGEKPTPVQWAGVLAGVLCVLAGSLQQRHAETSHDIRGSRALYAFILLMILITNSLAFVAVNDLGRHKVASGETLMDVWKNVYFASYYALVAMFVLLDLLIARTARAPVERWMGIGLIAALGVIGGASALAACAEMEASVLFTASSVSAILAGALISVFFFREKVSAAFFVMVALGVLAVVLVNS